MPRPKAIFLDVGGTLLAMGEPEAAYAGILRHHGYEASLEQVHSWLAAARREARRVPSGPGEDFAISAEREWARRDAMIRAFLRQASVEADFEACRDAIWESWTGTRVFRLFEETVPVLRQLKQAGFILGTVSNWEPRLAELCASHGIARYLDFILASEAEGYVKPGSQLFELALERAGVEPAEAIHVGDNPVEDIQAAESLGIRAVLIQRSTDQSTPRPHTPCIPTLAALLPLATSETWLQGRVESGKREAASFTQIPWVWEQFVARLGFEPHPGTLNLRIETEAAAATWATLRAQPGVSIEPESGYCAARCYPISIEGQVAGAIVLPMVSGYPTDVVEVLAPVALREALALADGSRLTLALVEGQP